MPKIILPLFAFLLLGSCKQPQQGAVQAPVVLPEISLINPPKNVILMIGDGMGISQISAAIFSSDTALAFEQFPVVGIHKPYSGSNLITDSAASATAMACGVKTNNGAIGVNQDSVPVTSLLEEAEGDGLATGVITTSTVVHATPAAFLAHQPSRKMFEEIALDLIDSGVDLLIGGGKKYFDQRSSDYKNLSQELSKKNYHVSDYFQTNLEDLEPAPHKNLVYFTANGDPVPVSKGRKYLPIACRMAAPFLQDRSSKGFFLMVEGAQIDWGGHAKDSDYIIEEMLDFDRAITEILNFAKRDGQTLVIVTGDHETGGYALNPGSQQGKLIPAFTSDYHTGTMIPVFAFGPGAELFGGVYENTDIHKKIRIALQLGMGETPAAKPSTTSAKSENR